ncbi:hypothetical protein Tco_0627909 [Tanacetum coccineum]|uniref:Uncharacterized protein n=1 Tax=Tanacetum coccineum TaxID=301880 RepID=A0ABQ4WNT2_9ASTR
MGKGLLGPKGGSCGGKGGRGGSIAGKGGGWLAKRWIVLNDGRGGGRLVVLDGKSLRESKNGCGEVGGVEKISSTGFKFMANGEDCLDGCDGAGGEVKGGGVELGVVNSLLGEIPRDVMGERGGDMMGLSGGPVWYSVGGDRFWYGGEMG